MKPGKTTGYTLGDDVDWTKTRAYGIGFNGLYLNLAGREAHGIVEVDDAEALMGEIARELEAFTDSDRGERVVLRVSRSTEI